MVKKSMLSLGIFFVMLCFLCGTACAAVSDSHLVTVDVKEIAEIDVQNNVTLRINTAIPGEQPTPATNSATRISWTINGQNRNITVKSTTAINGGYILQAKLGGVNSLNPYVTISQTAQIFRSGITRQVINDRAITYKATATVNTPVNPTGEKLNIIYTIE
jgi:hypothetical protein